MKEDYERAKQLDEIYLAEYQKEIEEDYQLWEEEQQKLPAHIEIVFTKKSKHYASKGKNYKENQESALL